MVIESYVEKYVIRRGRKYFLCFVADDSADWISSLHLARHFPYETWAEEALAEIRKRSASQVRRRRKVKA